MFCVSKLVYLLSSLYFFCSGVVIAEGILSDNHVFHNGMSWNFYNFIMCGWNWTLSNVFLIMNDLFWLCTLYIMLLLRRLNGIFIYYKYSILCKWGHAVSFVNLVCWKGHCRMYHLSTTQVFNTLCNWLKRKKNDIIIFSSQRISSDRYALEIGFIFRRINLWCQVKHQCN